MYPQSTGFSRDERDGVRAIEFDADSVERFAIRNGISRSQAYKEIAAGRLIARKIGTRTIVTREDAAKWRHTLPKMPASAVGATA